MQVDEAEQICKGVGNYQCFEVVLWVWKKSRKWHNNLSDRKGHDESADTTRRKCRYDKEEQIFEGGAKWLVPLPHGLL